MPNYQTSDFDYTLPPELIAQKPLKDRRASRLLVVNKAKQSFENQYFNDILSLIDPKDLLVFNNTKVIPARLFGQKASGGKLECLIERILPQQRALAHLKASKSPSIGSKLLLANNLSVEVVGREGALFVLEFQSEQPLPELLNLYGQIPLPPYIERDPNSEDTERYQTVYAKAVGAVAAPTAGLHFDHEILQSIKDQGVAMTEVTLHVGAGTFQPVRFEDLSQHSMHSEYLEVSEQACAAIKACRQRGGRVIAIGTTSVRSLETAAQTGEIQPFAGETQLFIHPGYQFQCVDVLLTNFHLPKSTLLMLVSAFAGYDLVKQAYQEAVNQEYRFFSYGDAMWLC